MTAIQIPHTHIHAGKRRKARRLALDGPHRGRSPRGPAGRARPAPPDGRRRAPGSGSERWLEINCLETVVEEGEDFRLLVYKKFDSEGPHKKMRVFWYTDPITADATDYEHLYAERQASNGYQSEHGRMGRDFHTYDDLYSETDETFRVWFNNSVDHGHDGECEITITDDDGVGIHRLEITSTPRQLPAEDGQEPRVGYAPAWQLAIFPNAPQYCLITPTDFTPCLGKSLPSNTHTASGSSRLEPRYSCSRPITPSSSQGDSVRKRCSARGDAGTVSARFSALRRSWDCTSRPGR